MARLNVEHIFTASAITAGVTDEAIIDLWNNGAASEGTQTIQARVVSATTHREVKIEAWLSMDGTNYVLDDTVVDDWSNDAEGNIADTDAWQITDVDVNKARFLKILITGLTSSAAAVDMYITY